MFDGVGFSNWFDSERTSAEIDLLYERFDLLTESFSLRFDPGFPCESPSSVTLTVLLEGPSPSAGLFTLTPFDMPTELEPETFFPVGKASLSAERAVVQDERRHAEERLVAQGQAVRARMAAGGGGPEQADGFAYTYVASGGQATFDDYLAAFTLGFTVGSVIGGGVGKAFRMMRATPEHGAARART